MQKFEQKNLSELRNTYKNKKIMQCFLHRTVFVNTTNKKLNSRDRIQFFFWSWRKVTRIAEMLLSSQLIN